MKQESRKGQQRVGKIIYNVCQTKRPNIGVISLIMSDLYTSYKQP
jgi:hypothetical protein